MEIDSLIRTVDSRTPSDPIRMVGEIKPMNEMAENILSIKRGLGGIHGLNHF